MNIRPTEKLLNPETELKRKWRLFLHLPGGKSAIVVSCMLTHSPDEGMSELCLQPGFTDPYLCPVPSDRWLFSLLLSRRHHFSIRVATCWHVGTYSNVLMYIFVWAMFAFAQLAGYVGLTRLLSFYWKKPMWVSLSWLWKVYVAKQFEIKLYPVKCRAQADRPPKH